MSKSLAMGSIGGGALYMPPEGKILSDWAKISMKRMPVHQVGMA